MSSTLPLSPLIYVSSVFGLQPVHAVGRYRKNSLVEILEHDHGLGKVYRESVLMSCAPSNVTE